MSSFVSICIPTYNDAEYIYDTLKSIIQQTYQNIEILVSDNASTDNTEEIVSEMMKIDSRIKYYRNPENYGYVKNVDICVNRSKGDIISVFHSDDVYKQDVVERQIKKLHENEDVIAVFAAKAEFERLDQLKYKLKRKYKKFWKNFGNTPTEYVVLNNNTFFDLFFRYGNFIPCPSFTFKRDLLQNVGLFTSKYPYSEDLDLWIRILNTGYRIGYILEPLFGYRKTRTQTSFIYKSFKELPKKYEVIKDYYLNHQNGLTNKRKLQFKKFISYGYIKTGIKLVNKNDFMAGQQYLLQSMKYHKYSIFSKKGLIQRFYYKKSRVQEKKL